MKEPLKAFKNLALASLVLRKPVFIESLVLIIEKTLVILILLRKNNEMCISEDSA